MKTYFQKKIEWIRSDNGATAIEYGLIAAAVAVALAAVIFLFGDDVAGLFTQTQAAFAGS